jgi:hypothetical protein
LAITRYYGQDRVNGLVQSAFAGSAAGVIAVPGSENSVAKEYTTERALPGDCELAPIQDKITTD